MQAGQEAKGDVLREWRLVLLGLPVELEGTNGGEFCERGVQNGNINVVAEIDPDQDEEAEVRSDYWRV